MNRGLLVVFAGLSLFACGPQSSDEKVLEVEFAWRQFYDLISAYDYDGLRAMSTEDFELLEAGRRMSMDEFVTMLEGMEARGIELSFETSDLNTEVSGDVAYTTNRMVSASGNRYLEGGVLRRVGPDWFVDRAFSMRAASEDR